MCCASHRQRKPDHDGWSITSGHDDPDHDDYDDDGCGSGGGGGGDDGGSGGGGDDFDDQPSLSPLSSLPSCFPVHAPLSRSPKPCQ